MVKESIVITVHNARGDYVKTIIDDNYAPGQYKVEWDGSDDDGKIVASGIYFIRMTTENISRGKKCYLCNSRAHSPINFFGI